MDTMEIIVYIGAAVIIAGLLLSFLINWDTKKSYEDIKGMMLKEHEVGYKKVDRIGFIAELHAIWEDCGLGTENKTTPLYVVPNQHNGNSTLTKESVFNELKKINYCGMLQSKEFRCGQREDVVMDTITLPAVVSISCSSNMMVITGE
jgi:uncharacterized protein YehS (DUF1456 family)